MGFQLPELPANIFGAIYGAAGFVATIIVIAKLSQGPNVSMSCGRNSRPSLESLRFSPARCNPLCRLKYLAWRLVGWFQVRDERSKHHTTRLREGMSDVSNGCCVVTVGRIVQVCAVQDCGTHPLVGHSKQPRTPGRTGESVRRRIFIQGSHQ